MKEARSGDLDGVRTHVCRIRTRMPSARTTLDGVGDFPSLFALTPETEEAPNDARLVMTGDRET